MNEPRSAGHGFRKSYAQERAPLVFEGHGQTGKVLSIESPIIQSPIRPMRIWVNPKTADLFRFEHIVVGATDQLIQRPMPCRPFGQDPDGKLFEMRICETGNRIRMDVWAATSADFEAVLWCDLYEFCEYK